MDKRQKILIVDDAKFNRDILKEILGDAYNYLEAEDGNQAIQMIGENIGIDLMLLDINMPQMNGFEVLEIMKRSQCIAETPVIMYLLKMLLILCVRHMSWESQIISHDRLIL